MRSIRRALFLSYYTPPRAGIATARTRQLLRYLPDFGWEVTAVTPMLDGADPAVVQTPYVDVTASVKRLLGLGDGSTHATFGTTPAAVGSAPSFRQRAIRFGYALTTYPDAQVGWFAHGRRMVRDLLARESYDAVISSSPPFTTNLILASLDLRIPWVADFRDLWSDGDHSGSSLRNMLDGALERWTLGRVTAATTITEPMARVIRSHRPGLPAAVIPNAFDPSEWEDVPFASEPRTTLVYAGQLFGGRRDPRPLFRAMRALFERGEVARDELVCDLYSAREPWLEEAIREHGLEGSVRVRGAVPRREILALERRADRLVVLLWDGANSQGIATGKIFEYLGARRPILAVGGPVRSAVDDILGRTGAGVRCRDDASLERAIAQAVREHRNGAVRALDAEAVAPYDAVAMTRAFAEVLTRCTSAPNRSSTVPG